ncbi:MAG: recombination regulator RecX [Spirochaetaceae bacterium]|jgi:regulatory protein|nr:recombination regulator RecX [Spirochaetaceae bacterium]
MERACIDGEASPPPVLKDALRLVARAEQFSSGLSLKLQRKGYSRAEIRFAVDALGEAGMLDDLRYARLWLASRVKRKADSPRELLYALCGKGISRDTAVTALKETLTTDAQLALLRRFVEKNGPGEPANDKAVRKRLSFDGFSAEVLDSFFDE